MTRPLTEAEIDQILKGMQTELDAMVDEMRALYQRIAAQAENKQLIDRVTGFGITRRT